MGCGAAGKSYWNKYNSAQQRRDKTTSFYGCQGFAKCWYNVCSSRGLQIPDPRWVCAAWSPGYVCASEHHLRADEQHCDNDNTHHHRHFDKDNDNDDDHYHHHHGDDDDHIYLSNHAA